MRYASPITVLLLVAVFATSYAQEADVKSRTLGNPHWDKTLSVETGMRNFNDVDHHAYSIKVYDIKPNELSSYWKSYLKDRGEKVSSKRDMVTAEQVSLTKVHSEPLDVYTSFTPEGANAVAMNVAFLHQGKALNADEHSESDEAIKELMETLARELNASVVAHQIDELQSQLEDTRKVMSKLQKEHEKLRGDLRKNQDKLTEATRDKTDEELELEATNRRIASLEEAGTTTEDAIKELEKLRKSQSKSRDKISKLESDIREYGNNVADAEAALPVNEKEQQTTHARISEQEAAIKMYQVKKEAILTGQTTKDLMPPEPPQEKGSDTDKKTEGKSDEGSGL